MNESYLWKMMQLFEMFNFEDQLASTKSAYNTQVVSSHPTETSKRNGDFLSSQRICN